jgi:hypothetical protein
MLQTLTIVGLVAMIVLGAITQTVYADRNLTRDYVFPDCRKNVLTNTTESPICTLRKQGFERQHPECQSDPNGMECEFAYTRENLTSFFLQFAKNRNK